MGLGSVRGASCRALRTASAGPRGWRVTGGSPVAAFGGFLAVTAVGAVALACAAPCTASGLLLAASLLPLAALAYYLAAWRATDTRDDDAAGGAGKGPGGWASVAPLASAPALAHCRPRALEAEAAKGFCAALALPWCALALLTALFGGGCGGGGGAAAAVLALALGAAALSRLARAQKGGWLPEQAWGPCLEPARALASATGAMLLAVLPKCCGASGAASAGGCDDGFAALRALLLELATTTTPLPPARASSSSSSSSSAASAATSREEEDPDGGCCGLCGAALRPKLASLAVHWAGDREARSSELLELTIALDASAFSGGGEGGGCCLTALVDPRAAAWGPLAPAMPADPEAAAAAAARARNKWGTLECPACATDNPSTARSCLECGADLSGGGGGGASSGGSAGGNLAAEGSARAAALRLVDLLCRQEGP